jgi:hypothetical protein
MLAILFFLKIDSPKPQKRTLLEQINQLDPIGIFFFIPSMVCLILALQWGGTTDPWSSPKIIGLLVTFAVLFIIFVVVEVMTPETAMAPTRVVLNRSMAGSMSFMFLLSGGMMSIIYYLSIWFQAAKGDSALHAGINTLPILLTQVFFGIASAVITQKVGYYVPAMLVSPVLCSVGAGLLSTLTPSSSRGKWIGYELLYGIGIGAGFQTSTLAAQTVLPRTDVSIGVGLMFFMQQLGGSVFLSVGQNLFTQSLVDKLSGVAGLDAQTIVSTGATELAKTVPVSDLNIVVQAYSKSLTRVFIMAAGLSAGMIFGALAMEWKSIKSEKGAVGSSKSAEKPEKLEDDMEKN